VGPIEMHESAHPTEQNRSWRCTKNAGWAGGALKKAVRGRVLTAGTGTLSSLPCRLHAFASGPPPDREPQTEPTRNRTGPVTAHQTFKNSSVYLDLSDSLGA
jgi:hypothetical protein